MKTKYLSGIIIIILFFASLEEKAQSFSGDFKVASILVDACVPGGGCSSASSDKCGCEGKNEMIKLFIGQNPINVDDIEINFPNNSFRGFCINSTTASNTEELNKTIKSTCGKLIEPINGIIPANSIVLIITSEDMCTLANSFDDLEEEVIVLYQCLGNYLGHFANYNSSSGIRTLEITNTKTGYSNKASYDRSLLIKQNGNKGAEDGARVDFDLQGSVTYINEGCKIPYDKMIIDAGENKTICQGETVSLNATVSSKYSNVFWDGGKGIFSKKDSISTNYTTSMQDKGDVKFIFTVTNSCGIESKDSLTISIKENAYFEFPNDTVICQGDTIFLSVFGGTSYSWNNGTSNNLLKVFQKGNYSVTVNGECNTLSKQIYVDVINKPESEIGLIGTNPLCEGDTLTLYSKHNGNFNWSNGQKDSTIALSTGGIYVLTVSNACGIATDAIQVNYINKPESEIGLIGTNPLCEGDTLTLYSKHNGNFNWSNGQKDSTITLSTGGIYVLTVSNACGVATDDVLINYIQKPKVTINILGNDTFCTGENTILKATSNEQIYWNTNANTEEITVSTPGLFYAYSQNKCGIDSAFINLVIKNAPTAKILPENLKTLCEGESITLFTKNNGNYIWSNKETTAKISVTNSGKYFLSVYNECGVASDSVIINFSPSNDFKIISSDNDNIICRGDSIQLTVDKVGYYIWSTGEKKNNITVKDEGLYSVKSLENYCNNHEEYINIYVSQPKAIFDTTVYYSGFPMDILFENMSSNATDFYWDFGDGSKSENVIPNMHTYKDIGEFNSKLVVTNNYGCKDSVEMKINVKSDPIIYIPNSFTPNDDYINDVFRAYGYEENIKNFQMLIYDRWGNITFQTDNFQVAWEGNNQKSGKVLASGIYVYLMTIVDIYNKKYQYFGNVNLIR